MCLISLNGGKFRLFFYILFVLLPYLYPEMKHFFQYDGRPLVSIFKARTHWADFPSADSNSRPTPVDSNMFDMDSRTTIVKSVAESADSGIESADSTPDSPSNPPRIGLWVRAFNL